MMERVQKIWEHPLYQEQFQLLQQAERERIFCNHTIGHFLDVARLMEIYALEEKAELDQELIYSVALLHDIGRYRQITEGIPHEEGGAQLAGRIMTECGFSEREIGLVQQAILHHRREAGSSDFLLGRYLYRADKRSRNCFCCPAAKVCHWPLEKRNLTIGR